MATPRTTRSASKAPLPVIGQKSSQAYGAKGKANLRSQVGSQSPEFASAFASHRYDSEAGDDADQLQDDDEPSRSVSPAKKRGRPSKKKPAADLSAVDEEDDDEPEDDLIDRTAANRTGTALDAGAGYHVGRLADLARPIRPANPLLRPQSPVRRMPSEPRQAIPDLRAPFPDIRRPVVEAGAPAPATPASQPSRIRVQDAVLALLSLFFIVTVFAWIPLPNAMVPARDNFFFGLKAISRISPYDRPPDVLEKQWAKYKHDALFSKDLPNVNIPDLQYAININLAQQVEELRAMFTATQNAVKQEISSQNAALEELRKILPQQVLVRFNGDKYEIPDAFWIALRDKISDENIMHPLLESFVASNPEQINAYIRHAVNLEVARAVSELNLLDVETFTEVNENALERSTDRAIAHYDSMEYERNIKLHTYVEYMVREELRKSPVLAYNQEQLELIAKGNLVLEQYEVMHTVNWLSHGLGARIGEETSRTKGYNPLNILKYGPNGPESVLLPWTEATQCWCTSDELATITISLGKGHIVYPQRLVIEHIPAHGTLDIKSAPRIIELWAHAASAKEAKTLTAALADLAGSDFVCGPAPTDAAVCIARGVYDIHRENHVQSIPMAASLSDMAMGVRKVTVRVTDNWGAAHTCIYRLRLTGAPVV